MTHPDYRRRGLIKKQFDVIHALSKDRGEVMQVITGIPSFYRFFGYEMCLELGGGYRIYPPSFPKLLDEMAGSYRLRPAATAADRLFVRHLHETNTQSMLFSMDVPPDHWDFEFGSYTDGSDGKFHWCIIEDETGEPLGYLHHDQRKFVDDTFQHPAEEVRGLYLHLGREHPVYEAIGRDRMLKVSPYAWYVRIADETTYLRSIKAQLEKHLSQSPVSAGYSGEVRLNFYNRGVLLRFDHGTLQVDPWQPANGMEGDAHFPANTFWSVLCGQKLASQLGVEIADCWMSRDAQVLLDTLFPPFTGQVWVAGGGG
jgi:hypothetical protein